MDDTNTVKCPLCRVDVPIDKIDLPNRCLHPQCPLKRPGACSLQSLSTPWAVISPWRAHQGASPGPSVVGTEPNKRGLQHSWRCWTSTHHAPLPAVSKLNQISDAYPSINSDLRRPAACRTEGRCYPGLVSGAQGLGRRFGLRAISVPGGKRPIKISERNRRKRLFMRGDNDARSSRDKAGRKSAESAASDQLGELPHTL